MKNLLLSIVVLLNLSIFAQRNDKAEYWNTWRYTAKEDMQEKFEEAAAKKTSMFNKTAETAILTYKVVTGSDAGAYQRIESGKSPADYDLDRSDEMKHWKENVAKYIAKNSGQVRWRKLDSGSYDPNPEDSSPAKYVSKTTFNVKADKILYFRRHMSRIAEVAEKRGWNESRILFRLVSGGNRNQFVMAVTFNKYQREDQTENETTFKEDYNKLFGWGSLEEDSRNFDASLEYWGEDRETLVLVPEMSTEIKN